MTETATSQIGYGPFETPRQPFIVGKLYSKVWRAPFTHGLTDVWRERCMGYWRRVEERFGYVFTEPRNAWADDPIAGPVVVTYATPLAMLKGERIPIGAIARPEPQQVQ